MIKVIRNLTLNIIVIVVMLSACADSSTQTENTGVAELDNIIDIVLRGDTAELESVITFTQTKCTLAEGLGGPPKCLADEDEGTLVEVLPMLGSEGHFLRKEDYDEWDGIDVSSLFAVYEVSDKAYSDENYPAGKYAIVFINKDQTTSSTLQVDQGKIVRIDYGFSYPPAIREEEVVQYLVPPTEVNP